jgi:hypothetical protein
MAFNLSPPLTRRQPGINYSLQAVFTPTPSNFASNLQAVYRGSNKICRDGRREARAIQPPPEISGGRRNF